MQALYILLGVLGTGLVLFVVKYFGGAKGNVEPAQDTKAANAAVEQAAELLGQRALVEAQTDDAKKKVAAALAIPDPQQKLNALADLLKGL